MARFSTEEIRQRLRHTFPGDQGERIVELFDGLNQDLNAIEAGGIGGGTTGIDDGDIATLASAQAYTDAALDSLNNTLSTTISDGDSTTLASAHSYADTGDTATLNAAKAYTDANAGGVSSTYVDNGDANTLAAANAYTDANATGASTAYVDTGDSNTLSSAHTYADSGDAATLSSAHTYADNAAGNAQTAAQSYADSHDATTLSSAHSYADSGDAATLSSAHSYADTGDTNTLNAAKAYTDANAGGVTSTYVDNGDANTLASANAYTDAHAGAGGVSSSYVDTGDANTLSSAHTYADTVSATAQTNAQSFATSADATVTANANAFALAAAADTQGFDCVLVAHFDTDGNLEGWDGNGGTVSVAGGQLTFTATALNQGIRHLDTTGGFKGRDYYIVKARVTRLAGATTGESWNGRVLFSTTTRTTLTTTNSQQLANPTLQIGVPQTMTWDMRTLSDSTVGPTEWIDGTIKDISFRLNNFIGHSYKIDWIAVGRPAPVKPGGTGVSQSYVDTQDTATLNAAKAYADSVAAGGSSGSFNVGGTGAVTRSMNSKVKEIEVSVLDFGADPTGAAFSTTAFANAIASGADNIHVPAGTYKIVNLNINKQCRIFGDGRHATLVRVTTTTDHGIIANGDSTLAGSQVIRLERINFVYIGAGQPAHKHGLWVGVRVYTEELWIQSFTWTGIYISSYVDEVTDATYVDHMPFFCYFSNTWVWGCGEDGMQIRLGANATQVINCNFLRNLRYGLFHHDGNDGTGGQAPGSTLSAPPTYGSNIIGGEASYNKYQGYRIESGTQVTLLGTYAEGNGLSGGTGYVNTPYDYYVGDSITNSLIQPGVVQATGGSIAPRVRVPAAQRTTRVACGGNILSPMCNAVTKVATGATLATVITKLNALLDELALRNITAGS